MKRIAKNFIFVIICTALALTQVSCNRMNQSTVNPSDNKAEECISKFFKYINAGDLASASLYLNKSEKEYNTELKFSSATQSKIVKEMFARTEYKITSSSYGKEKGEVSLQITAPDLFSIYNEMMSKLMQPVISKYMNGNEKEKLEAKQEAKNIGMKYVMDTLNSSNYPKLTNNVKLKLVQQDGKWYIRMNEDFIYALTGRMPQLLRKLDNKN